ncbi:MAG TPA: hypothetical protein VFH88_15160 [Candidatus Krumholzibacteria bacterium]|nr:hypothetical protein [Candidatus Krumholzibacteria bacterium]
MKRFIMVAALLMSVAAPAMAGDKPINLSLFTPISIAKETDSVSAFRFSLLYGKNTSVQAVDIGLVSHTTSGMSQGLAWSFVNYNEGSFTGVQLAAVNYTKADFCGFQWSWVNVAGNAEGFQLGFVNSAQHLHGIQVGLINIIKEDGFMPIFPIVNWSF